MLQETAKLILGNRFAIFIKTKSQFENTLRFREKKACLELTCTCINIVCHCSVLQEECWWNCHVNIPRKKNVLPSFNVACFSAFVTYGLYRKQKHSHFLCKLLSIFSHFLNLLQGFVDILIYIFSLSLWTVKKGKNKGNNRLTYWILNVLCSIVFLFTKIRPVILFLFLKFVQSHVYSHFVLIQPCKRALLQKWIYNRYHVSD